MNPNAKNNHEFLSEILNYEGLINNNYFEIRFKNCNIENKYKNTINELLEDSSFFGPIIIIMFFIYTISIYKCIYFQIKLLTIFNILFFLLEIILWILIFENRLSNFIKYKFIYIFQSKKQFNEKILLLFDYIRAIFIIFLNFSSIYFFLIYSLDLKFLIFIIEINIFFKNFVSLIIFTKNNLFYILYTSFNIIFIVTFLIYQKIKNGLFDINLFDKFLLEIFVSFFFCILRNKINIFLRDLFFKFYKVEKLLEYNVHLLNTFNTFNITLNGIKNLSINGKLKKFLNDNKEEFTQEKKEISESDNLFDKAHYFNNDNFNQSSDLLSKLLIKLINDKLFYYFTNHIDIKKKKGLFDCNIDNILFSFLKKLKSVEEKECNLYDILNEKLKNCHKFDFEEISNSVNSIKNDEIDLDKEEEFIYDFIDEVEIQKSKTLENNQLNKNCKLSNIQEIEENNSFRFSNDYKSKIDINERFSDFDTFKNKTVLKKENLNLKDEQNFEKININIKEKNENNNINLYDSEKRFVFLGKYSYNSGKKINIS
jgi:hypothetical protein